MAAHPASHSAASRIDDDTDMQQPTTWNFSLICYNVLCGAYVERGYFPRAPHWLLADAYRRQTIAKQLTSGTHPISHASIVALQEVDEFDTFWRPAMAAHGYDASFKPRTAAQMQRADGSAILWKAALFDLVDRMEIEYAIWPTVERKDNIGLGVLLRCKSTSSRDDLPPRYLAVVNTHLLYNPRRGDLKIGQMQILCNSIDAWLNRFTRQHVESGAPVPVISLLVCGDFNALPSSTLMQFAVEGELDLSSEAAFACMEDSDRAARQLKRQHMDGTESHHHQRALQEEATRAHHRPQHPHMRGSSSSSSNHAESAANKRRRVGSGSDQRHRVNESAIHPAAAHANPGLPAVAGLGVPTQFPSTQITSAPPDCIDAFFPFHPLDTPTHIRHQLHLSTTYVDPSAMRARHRIARIKRGLHGDDAADLDDAPLIDPHTGLAVRYRPTAHHHRHSAQVDQILFSPTAYCYDPKMWRADAGGDTPQRVMNNKLRLTTHQSEHTFAADSHASSSHSTPSPSAARLRVTSLLEFPRVTAFQPVTEVHYVQVTRPVAQPTPTAADATLDAAHGSTQSSLTTTVTEQRTVHVSDPGLPVPDCPSDHFPIGIRFQLT